MGEKILELRDLKTSYFTHIGEVKAIRGISFHIHRGEAIGIVGESGSGKSVTALSIMRLLQHPGKIIGGQITFKGKNLLQKSIKEMQCIRGNEISMIFQDSMTSLNPVFTVGNQIIEVILQHHKISKKEAKVKAVEMFKLVGISSPEKRMNQYPHEFSGGMRQRLMIGMALSCEPTLLIADEPTTALDVTIQAQILELMKDLKKRLDTSIILITHDLGVVAALCSRVVVMYSGLIMEEGSIENIFYNSKHPYTQGLLKSIPKANWKDKDKLISIEGTPPDLLGLPDGCPFMPRCSYAMEICKREQSPDFEIEENHRSMCWRLHDEAPKIETWMKRGDFHGTK